MQPAVYRHAFGPRQGCRIDDIERARIAGNADHDAAVLGHRDIVGVCAQHNFLDQLAGLPVENIKRRIDFIADIDLGTVRRECNPVRPLDSLDLLHHLVGGRINDVDAVPGAVGDIDAGRTRPGRNWCNHQQDPHMA